ncbi:Heat shock 70 kDa protein [Rhynchospora pubera]|uniref:Heat shock 70 kDa protein n=1 Tax=Rhynchospora pubera TaxID=906938 RepID=A0AAV8BPW3_9POAL|nr:Heat shock 70 kDa protein [Rhynchospora pubera]
MDGSGSSSGSGGKGPAIGIDLGSAYTRVALFDGSGKVRMIPDDHGKPAMPSYVAFVGSEVLVGEVARKQAAQNPANTIFDVIRLIGRPYSHPSVKQDMWGWPFKVVASQNDRLLVEVSWKGQSWQFTTVEICSLMLMQVKKNAEKNLRAIVTDAVLTVPVHFNYEQRQAMKDAGMIAGLNIIQIINVTEASSLLLGTERLSRSSIFCNIVARLRSAHKEYNMVIFDLGAGTLDVSLTTIKEAVCKVRATAGDVHLGGSDIEMNMVYHFFDSLRRDRHKDISNIFRAVMSEHRTVFEGAKIALSSGINLEPMTIGPLYNNQIFKFPISAEEFNKLNRELFVKCIDTINTCLRNAEIEVGKVDEVILIGGSTRIPMLQSHISQYFEGKELKTSNHFETAGAFGAALRAYFLTTTGHGRVPCLPLQTATTFSLGVQFPGGVMDVCIPKNTSIPTRIEKIIYSWRYNERNFLVEVYEGEGRLTSENNLLGVLELSGVPLSPNGCDFKLCFELDANGTITVMSGENPAGISNRITMVTNDIEVSRRRLQETLLYKEVEKVSKVSRTNSITESANPHKQIQMRDEKSENMMGQSSSQMRDEKSEKMMGQSSRRNVETAEYAIGIDFGTNYSCVAIWQQNRVNIIENEYGSRATCSCVAFTDTGRLIGDVVNKEQVVMNTIPSLNFELYLSFFPLKS